MHFPHQEKGFTLIELLVALALGLLIIAAVVQIYIISTRTALVQEAGSSIIDANVYGLQQMETSLRMAGLGLSDSARPQDAQSGILFGGANSAAFVTNLSDAAINAGQVVVDGTMPAYAAGTYDAPSNTNATSDVIGIRYRAPVTMMDCEGRVALGPRNVTKDGQTIRLDGQVIVEYYYPERTGGPGSPIALMCDAGRYVPDDGHHLESAQLNTQSQDAQGNQAGIATPAKNTLYGLNDGQIVVINDLDAYQVMYAMKQGNNVQYARPADAQTATFAGHSVDSVKLGILARGPMALPTDYEVPTDYAVLGADETLTGATQNHIRRPYEVNIMLRNSRGV